MIKSLVLKCLLAIRFVILPVYVGGYGIETWNDYFTFFLIGTARERS